MTPPEPPTPADVGCVCGKYRPRVYACLECLIVSERPAAG